MATKQDIAKQIISQGLVPLAVANTFLFIGSHMKNEDCSFKLGEYFIFVGTICLAFAVYGILAKYLVGVILDRNPKIDKCGSVILTLIQLGNRILRTAECFMLIGGCVFVLAHVHALKIPVFSNENENTGCLKGPLIFSGVFLTTSTIILVIGGACWIAISQKNRCSSNDCMSCKRKKHVNFEAAPKVIN